MKKSFAIVAALALAFAPLVSFGAQIKAGEAYQLLKSETINENLYAGGARVDIDGTVNGDVVVAGGKLYVAGIVRDDILAAGGTVQIGGTVNGDVRVVGGDVTIAGTVKGEVVALGGTVTIDSLAKLEKGLVAASGDVLIKGDVAGLVKVRGGRLTINGNVNGSVDAKVDQALMLGPAVIVAGNLTYSSPKEATLGAGATINGKTTYTPTAAKGAKGDTDGGKNVVWAFLGFWFLVKFVTILFAGLLMLWLAKDHLQEFIDRTRTSFWKETLRGFVLMIMLPITGIVLCVTLIGIVPAFALFFAYGFVMVLTKATVSILFGVYLEKLFDRTTVRPVTWKTVVGGTLVLAILSFVPVAGWILGAIFFLAAFGGWWYFLYAKFRGNVLS